MIQSFHDAGTADVYDGVDSRAARRTCPQSIWRIATRKLSQLHAVVRLEALQIPPGNQLEALRGGPRGQHSIRINERYRVCFVWTEPGPERVEIVDYH